jgi:hypothetical protein
MGRGLVNDSRENTHPSIKTFKFRFSSPVIATQMCLPATFLKAIVGGL